MPEQSYYQWVCGECGTRMLFSLREQHEKTGCDPAVVERFQVARAEAEMRNDNVATVLHEWGQDATKGLDEERQDAHVTVTARRGFAQYLRDHEETS